MTFLKTITSTQKILNFILGAIFISFAWVQLNDPDPMIWFATYLLVAIICILANFKEIPKKLIWIVIVIFLLFALYHFSYFMDWIKIDDKEAIFGEMVYEKPYLEGTREFLGLLMAAAALFFVIKQQK